jgi:hypothetical protein
MRQSVTFFGFNSESQTHGIQAHKSALRACTASSYLVHACLFLFRRVQNVCYGHLVVGDPPDVEQVDEGVLTCEHLACRS